MEHPQSTLLDARLSREEGLESSSHLQASALKRIRDAVLNCIYNYADDDEQLILELRALAEVGGSRAYSVFFNVLTHLDLEPAVAEDCWHQILDHRIHLTETLGRRVNFRTVICDYFCSVNKAFQNPVVVEIHVFQDQLRSLKYDSLTGLNTRATFEENLKVEFARAKRYETELSLLFFDLDDFKNINDLFGHLAGDMVLKDVGRIVRNEIRAEDTAARYGGEEIVIILPQTGKVDALILGERIRRKIESRNLRYGDKTIQPTISGGLASFPIDACSETDLLKFADNALYRAKQHGKNNIAVYSHNKRRFLRINFISHIQIRRIGFDDHVLASKAISKNLSVAGILFESDMFFEIGTRIELNVPMPHAGKGISVIGTVVRVEVFHSNQYEIGVSFLEMDTQSKNEISRYLVRHLKDDPQ